MMDFSLDDTQRYAFDLIEHTSSNVFIQGAAGTGKSVFIEFLRKHSKKKIWCLCPTGMAALNIKAQTIHRGFALPSLDYFESDVLASSSFFNRDRNDRIKYFDVLLIDEISMVSPNLLDTMDFLARKARKNNLPFGGMQVVIVGDLYQLPPVILPETLYQYKRDYGMDKPSFYCFDSFAYKRANFISVVFTKNYRQNSIEFIEELIKLRNGDMSCLSYFNRRLLSDASISNTMITITPNRSKADEINNYQLYQIDAPLKTYTGVITGKININNLPVPTTVSLKPGALVLFCKNGHSAEIQWCNGSMGKIIELTDDYANVYLFSQKITIRVYKETWTNITYKKNPKTKQMEECVLGTYTQLPLVLGYAITIHKSQGKTLDSVKIDFDRGAWLPGQAYTALSRVRNVEDIYLTRHIYSSDIRHNDRVQKFFGAFA
ncbi:MAG: AAA family ATPase [Alphaproteobacteria bacterium]|nr:AAA family ATPase [Alphaproteobacteria bacterium]